MGFLVIILILAYFYYRKSKRYKIWAKRTNIVLEAEIMERMKTTTGEKFIAVSFIKETPVAKHFLASTASGQQVKISVVTNGFKQVFVNGWK